MPNKHLHSGQGNFTYNFIQGTGDVSPGRAGYSNGAVVISAPSVGINTYESVQYITKSLSSDIGDRISNISQLRAGGGLFSDFHLFASPSVNTRFINLSASFTSSLGSGSGGDLQKEVFATLEDIRAYPRLNISSSNPDNIVFSPLSSGGPVKKTPDFSQATILQAGDTISRAVAVLYSSFKVPWNCTIREQADGDLEVVASKATQRIRTAYDPKYYLHFRTLQSMSSNFQNRAAEQNDEGKTFDNLKSSAGQPVGPGATIRGGTLTGSNVANTTIVVQNTFTNADVFNQLSEQSGLTLGGGNEPGCFPAGTRVLGAEGEVYIENIKPGDKVASFDPKGIFVLNEVKALLIHKTGEPALEIITSDDNVIQSTFYHKFYHPGFEIYKPIHQFGIGDPLRTKTGNVFIKEIKKIAPFEVQYNLELIGEPRSYLANGIVVHNIKAAPPLFPTDIVSPDDANPNL